MTPGPLLVIATLATSPPPGEPNPPTVTLQTGDLVFHRSRSSQARAIALATGSNYTHVGVIFVEGDQLRVLEAVEPVKFTALDAWLARSEDAQVLVRRPTNPELVNESVEAKMRELATSWLGHPYDAAFQWSDHRLYCSELVYKLYDQTTPIQVGELQPMSAFHIDHPVVARKLHGRYGSVTPVERQVVSPASQATDTDFHTLYAGSINEATFVSNTAP